MLYGLKTCDSCTKALKALPDMDFCDVRQDGVPDDVLQKAFGRFGRSLMNIRSTTWRELSEDERGQPPLELLKAHPTLMKRPLIVIGDKMFLGWTKDVTAELLGK